MSKNNKLSFTFSFDTPSSFSYLRPVCGIQQSFFPGIGFSHKPYKCLARAVQVSNTSRTSIHHEPYKCSLRAVQTIYAKRLATKETKMRSQWINLIPTPCFSKIRVVAFVQNECKVLVNNILMGKEASQNLFFFFSCP